MPAFLGFVYIAQYTAAGFDMYVAKYSQKKSFVHRYGVLSNKTGVPGRFLT